MITNHNCNSTQNDSFPVSVFQMILMRCAGIVHRLSGWFPLASSSSIWSCFLLCISSSDALKHLDLCETMNCVLASAGYFWKLEIRSESLTGTDFLKSIILHPEGRDTLWTVAGLDCVLIYGDSFFFFDAVVYRDPQATLSPNQIYLYPLLVWALKAQ